MFQNIIHVLDKKLNDACILLPYVPHCDALIDGRSLYLVRVGSRFSTGIYMFVH